MAQNTNDVMSIRQAMAQDAESGGAFFPLDQDGEPSGFNETVWFLPRGSHENRVEIKQAWVNKLGLQGTREVRGDGVLNETRDGRSTRGTIDIVVPLSVAVRSNQTDRDPDQFKVGDEFWKVKKVITQDWDLQKVWCVRREVGTIRNESRVG